MGWLANRIFVICLSRGQTLVYIWLGKYNTQVDIQEVGQFFKVLSEPVRLRLLNLLLDQGELCVCDLVGGLGLPQSVVSRHLAYLRKHKLLETRKEGQWVYYRLAGLSPFVEQQLALFHQHGTYLPELVEDLTRVSNKSNACC